MNAVRTIALLTGLVPILAIHATYLVSAIQGFVPWCFPYFESCTSISATGRHGLAFYLFKGTMIPEAVLLVLYWHLAARWLRALGDAPVQAGIIFITGALAALFLVVYTLALGEAGDMLRLQRRIGIIVYFAFTYLAQLLLVWRMARVLVKEPTWHWLLGLCATALSVGVVTVLLDVTMDNYEDYEDAFEWILALLIHLYFLVTVMTWRNFEVRYAVR